MREGDTLISIAKKYGVTKASLAKVNHLSSQKLRVGLKLQIPLSKPVTGQPSAPTAEGHTYTVRNGDHDWAIARKHGISVSELRALNPNVRWTRLQLGQQIRVPKALAQVATKPSSEAMKTAVGTYIIRRNDNDWIIARRLHTTPRELRRLNPRINWNRVRVGQKIQVPATAVAKTTPRSEESAGMPVIRSRYAIIAGDAVTVRSTPDVKSERITMVDAGLRVTVLDREGVWYKLRLSRGTEGWVHGYLLTEAPAATTPAAPVVRAQKLKTRVSRAERFRRSRNSRTASVATARSSFRPVVSIATTSNILKQAYSFRGVRYRYGAMSRSGTDCSGFTSQVFAANGLRIPRTSALQSRVGIPVSRQSLKAGDLVFFRTRRGTRVSHVGIYVGNGRFIHASSGGGRVQVNNLSDSYYTARFVGARRMEGVREEDTLIASTDPESDVATNDSEAKNAVEARQGVQAPSRAARPPKAAVARVEAPEMAYEVAPEPRPAQPVLGVDEIVR